MKRIILAGVLALFPFAASADDGIGRYQAIAVPESGSAAAGRVLFLDTRDGHVWEWRNAPTMANNFSGEGFTYIGKLTPGVAPSAQLTPQPQVGKCFTFNGKQFCE
ncbi:MAG TPA: hypothetical protein VNV38_17425 [Stellaceae bacterium]|jgi:hypothetical protein|nr:hypothetical protein [Stellaceae bacterium]